MKNSDRRFRLFFRQIFKTTMQGEDISYKD